MAGIDNLGKYGQITNAAKAAGGVDNLIHNVEKTAVSNAALGLRVQGAGIGVGVIGILALGYKLYQQKKQANATAQEAARAELRDTISAEEPQQIDNEDRN